MDLAKLKVFVGVAESGSLSKAALMLGASQPAISRQISALERDWGARLFHRTGRGVALTALGDSLLPRVRALLAEADQLAHDVESTAGVPVGEVRLGVLPSMSHPLVSYLFRRLRRDYPGVRLRVFEGTGGQLQEWLTTGRIDAAILFHHGHVRLAEAQLLARADAYLIGWASDPITRAPSVRFNRLHQLPLVLAGSPSGMRSTLDQIARRKSITLTVLIEVDSLTIQKDIVAEGDAYAVLAYHAVYPEVQSGRLQASRIVSPTIERRITLCTTSHHPLTLATREVVREIRNVVGDFAGTFTWETNASSDPETA